MGAAKHAPYTISRHGCLMQIWIHVRLELLAVTRQKLKYQPKKKSSSWCICWHVYPPFWYDLLIIGSDLTVVQIRHTRTKLTEKVVVQLHNLWTLKSMQFNNKVFQQLTVLLFRYIRGNPSHMIPTLCADHIAWHRHK